MIINSFVKSVDTFLILCNKKINSSCEIVGVTTFQNTEKVLHDIHGPFEVTYLTMKLYTVYFGFELLTKANNVQRFMTTPSAEAK